MKKIILFELNEVPCFILDYYSKKYPNSALAKALATSHKYETVTTDDGHLSPWITWPTLHRGVDNKQHEIKDFGENLVPVDQKYPPIWKILKKAGIQTGVFASMHSYPAPDDFNEYSFYVPDPFAGDSETNPDILNPFQKFNLAMSRKSVRNVDTGIDMGSAMAMVGTLPSIGIKLKTLGQVAGQLVAERSKPWIKTRRRTVQSVLAFDAFMKLLKTKKPQFTTLFSNHAASTMHRYWAATFPEHYHKYSLSDEWKNTYNEEIDFVMHKTNDFMDELVDFVDANPEYMLVVTSSMGQKATIAEEVRCESYCKDLNKLTAFLGLAESDWERKYAMHPQYNFLVQDAQKIEETKANLEQFHLGGKKISYREKEGMFSVDLGHRNLEDAMVEFKGEKVPFDRLGITNEKIDDNTGSTAYHIPEGSLFVYDPQNKATNNDEWVAGKSTCALAPSILENFNLPVPEYMSEERFESIVTLEHQQA